MLHVFVQLCVILCLCAAVCGRQFLSRVEMLMQFYGVFPGKGLGPGFSLSGRPSALDRTLFERGRRMTGSAKTL